MRGFGKYIISWLFLGLMLASCNKEPHPIEYGNDTCHFCQMTIVDKIHGAEIVTDKGKIFKFDAAECLLRYSNELQDTKGYQFLTNHFELAESFISMESAIFLISDKIPSPMGAYLTAFESRREAEATKQKYGGTIFNWNEINNHLIAK